MRMSSLDLSFRYYALNMVSKEIDSVIGLSISVFRAK